MSKRVYWRLDTSVRQRIKLVKSSLWRFPLPPAERYALILNVVAPSSLARLEHKRLICQHRHSDPFTYGQWMLLWEHTHDWFPANNLNIHHWGANRQA